MSATDLSEFSDDGVTSFLIQLESSPPITSSSPRGDTQVDPDTATKGKGSPAAEPLKTPTVQAPSQPAQCEASPKLELKQLRAKNAQLRTLGALKEQQIAQLQHENAQLRQQASDAAAAAQVQGSEVMRVVEELDALSSAARSREAEVRQLCAAATQQLAEVTLHLEAEGARASSLVIDKRGLEAELITLQAALAEETSRHLQAAEDQKVVLTAMELLKDYQMVANGNTMFELGRQRERAAWSVTLGMPEGLQIWLQNLPSANEIQEDMRNALDFLEASQVRAGLPLPPTPAVSLASLTWRLHLARRPTNLPS